MKKLLLRQKMNAANITSGLKHFLIVILFLGANSLTFAQLSAGDIAFIGVNEDSGPTAGKDHSFTWIALTDIPAGEVIYFTEQGVNININSWYANTEGHYSWTAPAGGLPCGSIVHIYETSSLSEVLAIDGPGTISGVLSGSGWNLSSGDQVLAYQSTAGAQPSFANLTFIAGIHLNDDIFDGESNGWTSTGYNGTGVAQCHLPPGLTNGVDCISLYNPSLPENDNNRYTGTLTGPAATIRGLINSSAASGNWSGDNFTPSDITPSSYSSAIVCATPCTDPTVPTLSQTPVTVCTGGTASLNITGTLNDATAWAVYTGSCGGTQIGTTSTGTFAIPGIITAPTTYFVRGEGGCVTPGSCGTIIITPTALDNASFSYGAASYCSNDSDPTPTVIGVPGGTFSAGAGLSINASTGMLDVSASTPGTYTVTYTTAGSCPNSSNVSVTINALDNASFAYSASSYCVNENDPTPTIIGLAGGTFSAGAGLAINASTGMLDVSASTPGTYTVTYTTAGSCPNSSSVSVTVNSLDNASFNYSASSYCVNENDPTPTITGLAGGSFSAGAGLAMNVSTGIIDLSASTPGTYTVTYTSAGSCPNSSSVSVTVNSLDNASFNYSAAAFCSNDSDPTPTITGLAGGSFSAGAGLSINASTGMVDVSASTPGTYTVTYTSAGSCPNSSSVSVTVNSLDNASFNYSAAAFCSNDSDPTPTITGLAGGTFSAGAGLSINASTGTLDVSASTPGTYTVTYTSAGSCPNSSNVSVTVNSLDNASFNYSAAAFCSNDSDPTPTITGLAGGTFSAGAGLAINASTGMLDVSASTPGTYTVTYTSAGSCPNSSSVSVTVNSLDNASFNYSAAAYCSNDSDPTPTITGLAGGTFSAGAGLSINAGTGLIDVSASTLGTYTVTYTSAGSCPNSSNVSVTVNSLDNASFNYSAAAYCSNDSDPTPTITGLAGGTFSAGAGLSINAGTGLIDVSASTPGTYTVTYTSAGSCPNSSNVSVTVNSLDNASFNYSAAAFCSNDSDPTPTITGLAGGTFTAGAGLAINAATGMLDVSVSTPGTYTITYNTSGTCPNSSTASVTVKAVSEGIDTQVACDSYTWIDGNTYTASNNSATHTLTNVAGCDSVVTLDLTINSSDATTDEIVACDTYTWIDGNTYTEDNGTATHTLTNQAGCDSVVTLNLTINNSDATTDEIVACDSYTWIDGNTYTEDNITATYTLTNQAGCDSVVTLDLTINYSDATTDEIVACDAYTWIDGITYTEDNSSATHTLTNAAGCDSVVTLNLTINHVDISTTLLDQTIISNASVDAEFQWLDCDADFAPILEETGQAFSPSSNGNYAIEITENGCVDTTACVNVSTLGLGSNARAVEVNVYPNPTSGDLSVEFPHTPSIVGIRIFSMSGQEVVNETIQGTRVMTLSLEVIPGVYILEITNDQGQRQQIRVVKQ